MLSDVDPLLPAPHRLPGLWSADEISVQAEHDYFADGHTVEVPMEGSLMGIQKVKFSSRASPEVLTAMREIASREGRQFQAVLQEAMEEYIVNRNPKTPRPEVMAHFRASVERNRRLYGLLAE